MKMLRPLVLALLVLSLVAAGLPVSDSLAHWTGRSHVHRKSKHKRYHRRSRAWWRRHRARIRQRQARVARLRAARLARLRQGGPKSGQPRRPVVSAVAPIAPVQGPRAPFDLAKPSTWTSANSGAPGTMQFRVSSPDGRAAGTASIAPVSLSGAEIAVASIRTKTLGGVPFAALRRTVIDRMVVEGGWVVNDMERQIQGRRVYVVIAQSGTAGVARQSWTFYFTEMNGRVYSLATNSPIEFAAPLAADAEQVMTSLRTGSTGTVAVKAPR
jgi:hypothetical protein